MDPLRLPAILKTAMEKSWRQTVKEEGAKISTEYRVALQRRIYLQRAPQGAPWPPLNPQYLEQKKRKRLDPRMLMATKDYISKIYSKQVNDTTWQVTVPTGIHPPSKMTYSKLRAIHEFGSGRIPPRPHWQPTTQEFENRKQQYGTDIEKSMDRRVRKVMQSLIQQGKIQP